VPEDFETFLRLWIVENIHPLAPNTDESDRDREARRIADELVQPATVKGFYGELVEAAKPYGDVIGFVRDKMGPNTG
jgi:hypothetical protein